VVGGVLETVEGRSLADIVREKRRSRWAWKRQFFTMRGLSRLAQPYANGYSEPALMADGLDVVQQRGDGLVAVLRLRYPQRGCLPVRRRLWTPLVC
jgi:hypothetical protein